ncbi:MAG: META domain-containing protein [Albidovulum sp.]
MTHSPGFCAVVTFGWVASFVAISAADPANARDVTGSLSYRERIALPPEATLVVEATDGSGRVVAAMQRPIEAAQVPLTFVLAVPEAQDLLLRGGLSVGGEIRWLSEPVLLPAGADPADIGPVALAPYRMMGFASRFRCGDLSVELGFRGEGVILRLGSRRIDLSPTVSASGAKFADPTDEGTWVWSKGDALTISLSGTTLPDCTAALPAGDGWRAIGHEPDWVVSVRGGQLTYAPFGAQSHETALPEPEVAGAGALYRLDPIGLALTITPELCRDTMTGMPHPDRVTLAEGTGIRTGCGGDPVNLIAGPVWRIAEIGSAPLPEGAEARLVFAPDGGLSGHTGCNSFTGRYMLSGEGLQLTPGGMTRMACPEPAMTAERAILEALTRVDRFDFDEGGDLLLIGGDSVLIRAGF